MLLRTHRLLTLPIGLAIAVAAAGCGGEKALTKAEYVKQADQICTDSRAKQRKLGTPTTVKDVVDLGTRTKPLLQDEIKRLRALAAPDEVKGPANAAYDFLDEQVPKLDELVSAAKADDLERLQSVATSASKLQEKAAARGKEIGLKVCAQG